ncbi:MAG: hydroxymethylglutaryl-CoA lyase, partial [Deinococcales bacterium]
EEMLRQKAQLNLVVYVSMGFGNPYNEPWHAKDTALMVERLQDIGVQDIALADTVANANANRIRQVLELSPKAEHLGLHLHAHPQLWQQQVDAAWDYGIRWFEGALGGIGGCPFAADALVGNLATESLLPYLAQKGYQALPEMSLLEKLAVHARDLAHQHRNSDAF